MMIYSPPKDTGVHLNLHLECMPPSGSEKLIKMLKYDSPKTLAWHTALHTKVYIPSFTYQGLQREGFLIVHYLLLTAKHE